MSKPSASQLGLSDPPHTKPGAADQFRWSAACHYHGPACRSCDRAPKIWEFAPGKLSLMRPSRRSRPDLLYGFLATEANAVVKPIHPKAMAVILTTDEDRDVWMRAPADPVPGQAVT